MSKNNYYEQVFEVTRLIPHGRITYYGAIADYLALGSARMVGWALNKCNWAQDDPVPAHRVVNRKGELSGRHHFPHPDMMQELLESEGVAVIDHKVKDFKKLLWIPAEELMD
jgi:methylated-DNA-protein-cysteine methyltransferase-like protein